MGSLEAESQLINAYGKLAGTFARVKPLDVTMLFCYFVISRDPGEGDCRKIGGRK